MSDSEQSDNKRLSLGVIVAILVFFIIVFMICAGTVFALVSGNTELNDQLAVVEVKGTIVNADQTVKNIQKFSDDEMVRGILIRINSPGGSVSASQEIVEAIQAVDNKPVVISMGDMAASGAYYVACAGPTIYANAGTLTGSIGVISQIMEYKDLMDFLKLKVHTVKTGQLKDSGSPFREFNDVDRAYFTSLGIEILDQFVEHVATARKLDKAKVAALADGRVWSGREAKNLGLIDEIGGFNAALNALKDKAGIKDKVTLVYPKADTDTIIQALLEESTAKISDTIKNNARDLINQPETFQYLYKP